MAYCVDCDSDRWQTRPLVTEGAQYGQIGSCQKVIKIWSSAPDGARYQDGRTDWLTDRRSNLSLTWLMSSDPHDGDRDAPETSVIFSQLTRLIAREYFIRIQDVVSELIFNNFISVPFKCELSAKVNLFLKKKLHYNIFFARPFGPRSPRNNPI
jgi:hypothetical protein